jgi:hypothetical protein
MSRFATVISTWRMHAHGILYRLEQDFRHVYLSTGDGRARRLRLHQYELFMTRTLLELGAQAEQYEDDEIREAIAMTRQRIGYPKCEWRQM